MSISAVTRRRSLASMVLKTCLYAVLIVGIVAGTSRTSVCSDVEDQLVKAESSLKRGIDYYRNSDFDLAIFELKEAASLLGNQIEELAQRKKLIDAHLYLGLAYIGIDGLERAKEQFSAIVALDNNFTLSQGQYSSKVVLLFNEARAESLARMIAEKETQAEKIRTSERSGETTPSPSGEPSEGKKWYKKWWVWGLAGVAVIGVAAAAGNEEEDPEAPNKPPTIDSITFDPNQAEYSAMHIISITCNANDDKDTSLRYEWTCENGEFENRTRQFTSTTDHSVKWSYLQYTPGDQGSLRLPREARPSIMVSGPREPLRPVVMSRSPRQASSRILSPKAPLRQESVLWRENTHIDAKEHQIQFTRSLTTCAPESVAPRLDADELVSLTVTVYDDQGLSDKRTFQIAIRYVIPVSRVQFVHGATVPGRDTRLKNILISIDESKHFGPYELPDGGYNNSDPVRVDFPETDMRSKIVITIFEVYGESAVPPPGQSSEAITLIELREFQLFSNLLASGTINLATSMAANASASLDGYPPQFFNDNNLSTMWACQDPLYQQFALIMQ